MFQINHSTVILCSTARLARALQQRFQREQHAAARANQQTSWQPIIVQTLSQWLNQVIENALLLGDIDSAQAPTAELNTMQETLLWEQSIAHSLKQHVAADLFDTTGLASAALEANRLIIEWNLQLSADEVTEETHQFLIWRQRFQQLCKQNGLLESVRYMNWQIECIEVGAGQLPEQIQLAGFDRFHPQLIHLCGALKTRGVLVNNYPLTFDSTQSLTHVLLNDQEAECRAAVAWAHAQLQQNPQARLAIVVPELEALRARLSSLLDDTFHPYTATPAIAEATRCYDFSLGIPLATLPIIQTALGLLRLAWQKHSILQTEIARLLHSPYWSASLHEMDARARLDERMRRELPLNFTAMRLASFVRNTLNSEYILAVNHLHEDLQQLLAIAQQQTKLQVASLWVNIFRQILEATHWQGQRSLSSHEYQAVQSFERVLTQLAGLDSLLGKINANEAIKRLTQLSQAQIFQPETTSQPAIQVMGMLEATAEPIDAIWVMGMNDHIWPPAARPNALIPAELQRRAGAPNASSQVQTEFAQAVHERLIKTAKQVIFSSAAKQGERQLRVSPLMHGILQKTDEILMANTLAEQLAAASTQDWQWLNDAVAPPIDSGEHIVGGTALLKAQAICPAWAFYQYRLGARKLDEAMDGLNVMERGTLVHAVLARFWHGHSAQYLNEMPIDVIRDTLKAIANAVMDEFNQQKNTVFTATFLTLEVERLVKLVTTWLIEVEMLRPLGFNVMACEQEFKVNIEGISIKLVIDRIDTLDDGRLLVMDYKTGRQMDYKNWADDKITEPQLPIYAAFVLQDTEVAAVCFAKVRNAEHAFIGLAASSDLVQGAMVFDDKRGRKLFDENKFPHWLSIIQHWQTSISATARSLKNGDAAVKFVDEKQLEYCEVLSLLRLPERQLQFERQNTGGDS